MWKKESLRCCVGGGKGERSSLILRVREREKDPEWLHKWRSGKICLTVWVGKEESLVAVYVCRRGEILGKGWSRDHVAGSGEKVHVWQHC